MTLAAWLYVARCSFQRRAAYRLANFTGIAVNFFFFLIHAQVLLAFFAGRETPGGWRPGNRSCTTRPRRRCSWS